MDNQAKLGVTQKAIEFWKLMIPYWRSEDKYKAWGILVCILAVNVGSVYITVLLNQWNASFYNALQELNKKVFISQCYVFIMLAAVFISVFVLSRYLTSLLAFRWRAWLTHYYLDRWLDNNTHYRLSLETKKTDNPDQRIAQDLAGFSTGVLSLGLSIFKETLSVFSFVVILWGLSGPLHIPLGQHTVTIPGYLVWAVLIYALVGTYIMFKIGKPVIQLDFDQEKFEADFRFHLIRLRERSEEVALYKGEDNEAVNFRNSFKAIKDNFRKILNRNIVINSWQIFYNNFSTLFPVLMAAPMFFLGMIKLGILMQIGSAFREVKDSLSLLIMDYQTIAQLIATTNRISSFSTMMKAVSKINSDVDSGVDSAKVLENSDVSADPAGTRDSIRRMISKENHIILENLTLRTPSGISLIQNLHLTIGAGERVLLMGASGLGKSTLTRAIAGIWRFGSGAIHLPNNSSIFMVPQKPYMPIATLREGLFYPSVRSLSPLIEKIEQASLDQSADQQRLLQMSEEILSEKMLHEILIACRLDHLLPYLDEVRDWGLQLSLGEQQRIIFARILIRKPEWIIMDEPTASMDKKTEANVYSLLHQYLPNSTIITIGHSPTLKAFHHRVVELDRESVEDRGEVSRA